MVSRPRHTGLILSAFVILLLIGFLLRPRSVAAMETPTQVQSTQSLSQAYYIIFQRDLDGIIRPLSHSVVQLSTPLTSMDLDNSADLINTIHGRNCERLDVRLQSRQGVWMPVPV